MITCDDNIKKNIVSYFAGINPNDLMGVLKVNNVICEVVYMEEFVGDFLNLNVYIISENGAKYIDGSVVGHKVLLDMVYNMTPKEVLLTIEKEFLEFILVSKDAYKAFISEEVKYD